MVLNKKVGLFDNAGKNSDDDEEDFEQADLPHHVSEVSDCGRQII